MTRSASPILLATEPAGSLRSLRALVFDLDGTLYDARVLRRRLLPRLLRAYAATPLRGWQAARILFEYRRALERMRAGIAPGAGIRTLQLEHAAAAAGAPLSMVEDVVHRWMEREPLGLLRACIPSGLEALLEEACRRRLRLAVLSDYPALEKLQALGLDHYFPVVVCAQDPDVQALKPDPRGLRLILRRLAVESSGALYIGDRAGVDGAAAQNAGIRCLILDPGRGASNVFDSLRRELFPE